MKLGELCEVVRGSSPRPKSDPRYYGGPVPRLMVSDLSRDGMHVTPCIDSLTLEGAKKSRPMKKGEVVIAVSGAPGLPAILEVDCCIHDGFVGLRKLRTDRISTEYLFHFLISARRNHSHDAVGAIFKNLTTEQIRNIVLPQPLPPLPEQRRIAAILDQADAIRRKRQKAIELTEKFLKSAFLEMFGDPVSNPKGLSVVKFRDVCAGIFKGAFDLKKASYRDQGIPFLRIADIQGGTIDLSNAVYIEESTHRDYEKSELNPGDLIFSKVGTIDRIALIPESIPKCNISQNNVGARLKRDLVKPTFALAYLLTPFSLKCIRATSKKAVQDKLVLDELRNLDFLLPSIEEQRRFDLLVASNTKSTIKFVKAHEASNNLFNSLVQRAFCGELSPVEVP